MMKDWKKYLAELLGTMILTLVGVGTAVVASLNVAGNQMNFGATGALMLGAIVWGLTLMGLVYIIGPISGCNVNPAVSLGLALKKKLSWKDFGFYVVAQIIGAIVGVVLVFAVYALFTQGSAGFDMAVAHTFQVPGVPYVNTMFATLLISALLTFVFVLTIIGVIRKSENSAVAGLVIGLTLALVAFATPAVNPAVHLATAIFGGTDSLKDVWVFLVGPLLGGALAAGIACLLFKGEDGAKTAPKALDPDKKHAEK